MPFSQLPSLLGDALSERGYAAPTPVQAAVLEAHAHGRDLVVSAQTGSGKTVAFGLAIAGELLRADGLLPQGGLPLSITGNAGPGVVLRHLSFGQVNGSISGNQGAYPNGIDCLSTGALRTDPVTRGQSNPMCLQE